MPKSRKLSADTVEELCRERAALEAQGVSLRPWAEEMAQLHGVSWHTIYRASAPEVSTRRRRSDHGTLKALEAEALADIAALTVQRDFTAELALETLNYNRHKEGLPPYEVHLETVRRHLRQLGISRADNQQDRRVHRRWEAPYPGYLWQMDSTVAASYYIDADNTIGYESPVVRGKNKAGNGRPRVWMICIVDDYSRVIWARYYTGNNATTWKDALVRAMRKGAYAEPDIWPAFGVPERLYTDQDQAMKAKESVEFLEAFGIERMLALPSTEHFTNAQAKGKVERAQGFILHGFETVTRGERFPDLEAMNRALGHFLLVANNRLHGETGAVPFERWLEAEEIRVLPEPEIVRRLSARSAECTITPDIAIHLQTKTYQLPRRAPFQDHVGHRVTVRYYQADLSRITLVLDGQAHEIDAVEAVPDKAGEFKQAPVPAAVGLKKALIERDVSHLDTHGVFEYRAQKDPRSYPIRPREVEHPVVHAEFEELHVRRGKIISRLQQLGLVATPPSELERAAIDALMAGRSEIPEADLTQFIEARRSSGAAITPLRARAAE